MGSGQSTEESTAVLTLLAVAGVAGGVVCCVSSAGAPANIDTKTEQAVRNTNNCTDSFRSRFAVEFAVLIIFPETEVLPMYQQNVEIKESAI